MQPSRMRTFGVVESSVMPECSIPVKITLTPVHQTALSTLSWKMVHSLMTEVHADIRAHLANVGLDRLLSQKNGIVIHPLPDDFSAFDVDISIIPHATEEEVLAVRARFGEILPLTLFDASLERFLKEKERCGKSPDMGTFCNPHTEENNEENTTQRFYTIFTNVTLPGTYAEQLCALQPTQVLRLQREARLDIHDCLERGGLAEVVPIHMIHVTPSVESGSFEVEVHAPKTIPGETYASIETCLSSHIPIPRIGTYLESVWGAADASFSGQSNPTLSPRDHQGSAQNKDSHVGRPMIIPVSMKLSISHARGLGKLAVGSLGELRERVRADVYEHLCFHNLDRYIFLDGIKVKPVTNHEVIDVEVRNTKGNSIVPKLRAALSETIPIPSTSAMLDAALRTTRLPCSGRVNPTHTQSSNEQPAARSATRVQTAAQRTRSSNNSTVSPAGTSSRGPCTYVIPYICPRLRRGPEIPERYIPSISREVVSPPPSSQQSSRSRGRSSKSMTTTH